MLADDVVKDTDTSPEPEQSGQGISENELPSYEGANEPKLEGGDATESKSDATESKSDATESKSDATESIATEPKGATEPNSDATESKGDATESEPKGDATESEPKGDAAESKGDATESKDAGKAEPGGAPQVEIKLDSSTFNTRIERLFQAWEAGYSNSESVWHSICAFVTLHGKQQTAKATPKSAQLQLWLFGYEFPETLMILTRTRRVVMVAGPKKVKYLKELDYPKLSFWDKKADGNISELEELFKEIKDKNGSKVARFKNKGEEPVGPFAQAAEKALSTAAKGITVTAVDREISVILATHDDVMLEAQKKAGVLCCRLLREVLVQRIEGILDMEEQESHEALCQRATAALDDPKRMQKWTTKFGLTESLMDVVYALVQSGTKFNLKPSAPPSPESLHVGSGCIVVGIGAKYNELTANVTRTLLVNATKEQKQATTLALSTLEVLNRSLRPGASLKKVYEVAKSHVQKKASDMVPRLPKCLGHVIGLEFRDNSLSITAAAEGTVHANMAFNISVSFSDCPYSRKKNDPRFSVWFADTLIVGKETNTIITDTINKLEVLSYELEDEKASPDGSSEKQSDEKARTDEANNVILQDRLRRRARPEENALELAEQLAAKQKVLRAQKMSEIEARFRDVSAGDPSKSRKTVKRLDSITVYRDPSEFPKDLRPNKIFLDVNKEAVLVPIRGVHVPFHVSMIRNVVCQEDNKKTFTLRLNFQVPGSSTLATKGEDNPLPDLLNPRSLFIKELLFSSSDDKMQTIARNVRELQRRVKAKENMEQQIKDVDQKPIQLNRTGKRVVLKNLLVKHTGPASRRVVGTLEAHLNGLRFQAAKSETIDINYDNIRHALFQPCDNELVVLIHFHLKSSLMVNKKRVTDVQFYTETGSQVDDLDQRRGRSSYDPDEIAEEERESELRRRLNAEFARFVEGVEEISKMVFEIPQRKLGFFGVPKNSSVFIMPTAHAMVHLLEWPPFVLSLEDVEVIAFERVMHNLRNFDAVFVFQDYFKPVRMISNIPIESLDVLKKWLNEMDMVWYENPRNLNWAPVLRTMREDIPSFVKEGGFNLFLGDESPTSHGHNEEGGGGTAAAEDGESSSGDDEDYEEGDSGDGSGSDESDDESDEESLAEESDDDGDYRSVDSDEESGMDWDELEEEAREDDRKRGYGEEEDEEDDSRRKRAKRARKR